MDAIASIRLIRAEYAEKLAALDMALAELEAKAPQALNVDPFPVNPFPKPVREAHAATQPPVTVTLAQPIPQPKTPVPKRRGGLRLDLDPAED